MNFLRRVGGFFILFGFICVAIYFITEPETGGMRLLTAGVAALALGIWLQAKNRPEQTESSRFVSMRKMAQRGKEEREKRLAKRKEKERQKKGR